MDFPRPSSARSSARRGYTLVELLMVLTPVLFLGIGVISAYLFLGRNFTRLASTQQQDVKGRRALFYFTQDVGSAISFTNTASANLTMTVPTTLTLGNCTITSGGGSVTCASTAGLAATMALSSSSPGIAPTATVSSVTNATTFVMSPAATANATGLAIRAVGTPATITYLYDSAAGTLTRTAGGVTTTLLTDIDASASSPSNGFVYYSETGTALSASPNPNPSTKSVEFAFTTKVGTASIGTQDSYSVVSPRVIARNKELLQ